MQAEVKRLNAAGGTGSGPNSHPGSGLLLMPPPMAPEEVERFAMELAEATDACARAQRVLLGAGFMIYMASYDVASNSCQPRHPLHLNPRILSSDGIL